MKISIITATFNSAATLGDTLESVLSQNYTDYELLVQDGGSSDGTLEIIESYRPRFEGRLKLVSEPDQGIYDAMNRGIARASGDAIGILNSDDTYADSSVLGLIADGLAGVDAVYGDLDFVSHDNTDKVVRRWKGSQHVAGSFLKGWHPAHPTFYARSNCYKSYGSFDVALDVSADFELMLRFLEKNKAASRYIPHTLVKMRVGGESTGSLSKIIQGNRNILRAFRKNGYDVSWFYPIRRLFPKIISTIKTKIGL